jgi:hypothetical protein
LSGFGRDSTDKCYIGTRRVYADTISGQHRRPPSGVGPKNTMWATLKYSATRWHTTSQTGRGRRRTRRRRTVADRVAAKRTSQPRRDGAASGELPARSQVVTLDLFGNFAARECLRNRDDVSREPSLNTLNETGATKYLANVGQVQGGASLRLKSLRSLLCMTSCIIIPVWKTYMPGEFLEPKRETIRMSRS